MTSESEEYGHANRVCVLKDKANMFYMLARPKVREWANAGNVGMTQAHGIGW